MSRAAREGEIQPAGNNPTSVFNTLCRHLSDKPVDKALDALPSSRVVQGELQSLEDATGLRAGAKTRFSKRVGPRGRASTDHRSGDLRHRGQLDGGLTGGVDGGANGSIGLAGARADGDIAGDIGVGGRLHDEWSHPLGSVEVDGEADARVRGKARGDATLDATGLHAKGEAGVEARAHAVGHAKADTVFGRAEGTARAAAEAHANADGDLAFGPEGLGARVKGKIGAQAGVEAHGEARSTGVKLGGEDIDLRVKAKGRAEVAARAQGEAKADARMTKKGPKIGVDVGGEAFAGAKAEGEISGGLGEIVTVKAKGGVWAGAGAQGNATLHFDEGKLKVGLRGGAAVKVGAGGGVSAEIDVKKGANAAVGAGIKAITAPIRYALDPMAFPRDAMQASMMATSIGTQLANLPEQMVKGASLALSQPPAIQAAA